MNNNLVLSIEGGHKIGGTARIAGSKNGSLAVLAATILNEGQSRILDVPDLSDIATLLKIFDALGIHVDYNSSTKKTLVDASEITSDSAPYELVSKMRASFFIIGPLLARLHRARIPLPGGCSIGARPVDLHLRGLASLGAEITIDHGIVEAKAQKLTGANIVLDYPSVGATQTILMAACLAEGTTLIENAAQEPEVADLVQYCRSLGVEIEGAGTARLIIQGQKSLNVDIEHRVIPDRIEVGTFIAMSAVTRCPLVLAPVVPEHLYSAISKYQEMGLEFEMIDQVMHVNPCDDLRPVSITTAPFPGFPTDMQAQLTAALSIVPGTSSVEETVFENRFLHVAELRRMGANIQVKDRQARITGVDKLLGAPVEATDLRASAALIIAALVADGVTQISEVHHLMRGYEDICGRLESIGAKAKLAPQNEVVRW
ncbi:MAG: UDP-N-acetylglucosamine 1-carboxyvinyltransferase [Leptolyngbyaceae bacterium]|nr:UDP-N-acetylglucosamine 1-carboxyvinyltransferase [Leptolyngbyaceae bacterium]